jgi:hypothetical protein
MLILNHLSWHFLTNYNVKKGSIDGKAGCRRQPTTWATARATQRRASSQLLKFNFGTGSGTGFGFIRPARYDRGLSVRKPSSFTCASGEAASFLIREPTCRSPFGTAVSRLGWQPASNRVNPDTCVHAATSAHALHHFVHSIPFRALPFFLLFCLCTRSRYNLTYLRTVN